MTAGIEPPTLTVRGGVGGVAASRERMHHLADALDDLADRMRERGAATLATAADADLLLSAVAAPVSFARAEAAVVAAATGADGALGASASWEADALAVRATVTGLAATDVDVAGLAGALAHRLGTVLAPAAVGAAAVGLGVVATTPVAWPALLAHRDVPADLARRLGGTAVTHPALVGPAVLAASGLAVGTAGYALGGPVVGPVAGPLLGPLVGGAGPASTSRAAGLAASAYGAEGTPRVSPVGPPVAVDPPRGVADLLDGVAAAGAAPPGGVTVDTLVRADGTRRHVVHLPGTDDMTTRPWTRDDDVRDLGTNLRLAAGDGAGTTYGRGVVEALGAAGVAPDEAVMLVGHSQGGMQAAALATADTAYDVRQVVSAGAPLGPDLRLPPEVSLLGLEHEGDPVPLLAGRPPPDAPGVVTVGFSSPGPAPPDPVERHALGHYRDAAAAVDASADPSLVEHRRRMAQDGFLDAVTARRRTFVITR